MTNDFENAASLRKDRSSIASHVVGLLKALKQAALPHQYLAIDSGTSHKELIVTTLAHLEVFTVRALETFFRDCFVILCARDADFLSAAADSTKGKIDFSTVHRILSGNNSLEDFLAVQRNFQNLDVVNQAFEPFLGKSLFVALDEETFDVYLPGNPIRRIKIQPSTMEWRKELFDLFDSRHEIIHNANRPLPSDQRVSLKRWECACLISQLFAVLLGERLNVGLINVQTSATTVMLHAAAMANSKEQFLHNVAEIIKRKQELEDQHGYIGPAIIFGKDLMRTSFKETIHSGSSLDNQQISHIVNIDTEGYVLETLYNV